MAHRFFVPASSRSEGCVHFSDDQRKQLKNVLRLKNGDIVVTFDNSGREFDTEIVLLTGESADGRVVGVREPDVQPAVRLTLVQSLLKGEKTELVLQKCTELGVAEFVLMETARSVRRIGDERKERKLERWNAIVKEATEQSGGTIVPVIIGPMSFREAVTRVRDNGAAVIAWEAERSVALTECKLSAGREFGYIVGPEGGLAEEEIELARSQGVVPVSLGNRVLRSETAAIAGSALIIHGLAG